MKKIILILLFPFYAFGQIPNEFPISLSDVIGEIPLVQNSLNDCFLDACANGFDPLHEGAKDRLRNFMNYRNPAIYNISSIVYSSKFANLDEFSNNPQAHALTFSNDGTQLFSSYDINNEIRGYDLSVAWNVSTATYDAGNALAAGLEAQTIIFSPNGETLLFGGYNVSSMTIYTLVTNYDLSTASFSGTLTFSELTGGINDIHVNDAGTRLYLTDDGTDDVYQYNMSSPWNILSLAYSGNTVSLPQASSYNGIAGNASDTKIFLFDGIGTIFEYDMSSGDLSTAVYNGSSGIADEGTNGKSTLFMNGLGDVYYVCSGDDTVYQFSTDDCE